MAWLAGYAYRKKGAVNHTTAGAQTNYQLKLVVGESSGASGEDVDCESNCQSFPNDIRFTKEDGETKHDYWIEKIEGTTPNRKATVIIEVASIPVSGSVDFYMYYRKTSDSGESHGDNTFAFFADFTASDIDNNGSQENINVDSGTWKVKYNSVYQDYIHPITKDPSIIKEGDIYYLFYTCAVSGTGIAIAKSNDKIHWEYLKTLSIAGYWNAWAPCVFKDGATFYLFWTASTNSNWSANNRIVYATSSDLETWTFQSELSGLASAAMDPTIKKFGTTYYLYYSKATNEIRVGTASNISGPYTDSSNNPLLTPTAGWEGSTVEGPQINLVSGTYYLHYAGGSSDNGGSMGYATSSSPDNNFTKQGEITISPSAEWFSVAKTHPCVIELDGEWELWFCGTEIAEHRHEISYAVGNNFPNTWSLISQKMYRADATSGEQIARFSNLSLTDFSLRGKIKCHGADGNAFLFWRKAGGTYYQARIRLAGTYDHYIELESPVGGWHVIARTDVGYGIDHFDWQKYEIKQFGNSIKVYINDLLKIDVTNSEITSAGNIGLKTYVEKADADDLIVSKYVAPEPTWGSWGAEESESGALDYEDFTTFTEVDVAADRIQKTANHIDHLSYRNETTYLYKDYGAAHFGNFTHKIRIKLISSSVAWSASHTWLIANDIAGSHWMESNNKTFISIFLLTDGSNIPRIYLREMYNGSANDDYYVCSLGTGYYLKIVKSGTTLTAYIYSDSEYSILLDTLIITLHADHNLRYLYGCNSDNSGNDRNVVLDIDNFALGIKHALTGAISATSDVTGALKASKKLSGAISATTSISGALTVLEDNAIGCVMTFEGGNTYNDQTTAANNATINDVQTMFDTPGDILYYGDIATYACVKIKYSTKGVIGSGVIVMEYSKGSGVWGTLNCTDESNKFTEDPGTYLLSFTPPGDWATDTVDGKTHYWIRYRLTSSEYTINPKLDQLWVFEVAPPSYEDFTTFTEVDVGANRIQKTAYHIDHLTYRNETTYLYKDYGAAHFDDFEHRIKVRFVSSSEAWSGGHTWLLANDVAGAHWMEDNNKTYISIFLLSDGSSNAKIWLREMYNGSSYDDTYTCSFNTWYYVKIIKSGTSINAYVYSDSDYSTLVDTLTLTLQADHTLRYLYGCNSDNDGTGRYGTLDVENFDIEGEILLAGAICVTSNVSGAIKASKKLSGAITSTSALAGILSCGQKIAGTISATSSISGTLTKTIALAGVVSGISTVSGSLCVEGQLSGVIAATTSVSGSLRVAMKISGVIAANTSVLGALTKTIALSGIISATSSVSGTLSMGLKLSGAISASSSLHAALSVPVFAESRGFYYAKLGSTILTSLEKGSFRITEELNKIPSFEFEISNCAANRAAITAGITDTLTIYRRLDGIDTLMFTGRIDVDAIEYLSLERIRIPGYAAYIDLNFRFHQHLNSEDAENVDKVFRYTGSYTDYTTQANNDTINDVLLNFSAVNRALYIGQGEQFFGAQVKYSTKGVQAGSTTVVFEFSKGSGVWSTLDVLDETRAFTEDAGTYYITIPHKPSDWAKDTVNSVKKFWIRARVTAGAYTTSPKLDRIKITNIDVYRVYYFDTAANSIMDDILAGTGYSMDGVEVCPSNPISMVGEYETKLRFIAGVANALTWDDSGDKKAYQWWIDTSKKVHFKQKRGTVRDKITQDLVILNNVMDYFNLSNRLHFLGNYDGLNQLRAVIEDTSSQDTHAIRELAVIEERYNNYTPLKEAAQKAMTHTKAPLQKIPATLPTTKWLANNLEVGDTVTIHQPRWNIDEQALQIVRADIGPSTTKLDIGISQEHLDGLKAGLQRRLDITGIRMHGSTSLLQFGPETMNYQRVDATTVYPARLKFEIPSDARYIHKILISWKLGNYRADVTGGEESEGHDHTGFGGAGGAHEHGGYAGAGGAHDSSVLDGGLHTPTELGKAHTHEVTGSILLTYNHYPGYLLKSDTTLNQDPGSHRHQVPPMASAGSHTHTNPHTGYEGGHIHSVGSTGGPSNSTEVVSEVVWDEWCEACYYWLVSSQEGVYVATDSHTHSNPNTGVAGGHDHSIGSTNSGGAHSHPACDTNYEGAHTHDVDIWPTQYDIVMYPIMGDLQLGVANLDSPAHAHTINEVPDHYHTAVAIAAHVNHVIGTQIAHGDHSIVTQAAAMIDMVLGIVEIAGGTTMMLTVNGEDVTTVDGDGTDIVITGFCNTGSNTVEIAPIVGSNVKGGATLEGRGVIFIESSKF